MYDWGLADDKSVARNGNYLFLRYFPPNFALNLGDLGATVKNTERPFSNLDISAVDENGF